MNGQGLLILVPALIVHIYSSKKANGSAFTSAWAALICLVIIASVNRFKLAVGFESSLNYNLPYFLILLISIYSNTRPWGVAVETIIFYLIIFIVITLLKNHLLLQLFFTLAAMFAQYIIITTYFEDYAKRIGNVKNG